MTIYEIKQRTQKTSPHFFDSKTLKFFGQTMASFKVHKLDDGRFEIVAPMRDSNGRNAGSTKRVFNPVNNELKKE